jgi:hypothetical protein
MKKHTKQAQFALEFMMTYGWIVLIIMVSISFLAFSGVFSSSAFMDEQCIFDYGIACSYLLVTENPHIGPVQLQLHVKNNLDYDMYDFSLAIEVDGDGFDPAAGPPNVNNCWIPQKIAQGEVQKCGFRWDTVPELDLIEGDRIDAELIIQWDDELGFTRIRLGHLLVIVEP